MKTLAVLLCILCLVTAGQGYFQFLRSSDQPPNLKFDPTNIQEVIFFTNQFAKAKIKEVFSVQTPQQIRTPKNIDLDITVHIEGKGDIYGHDNEWVGTKGQSLRLEGFSVTPNRVSDDFYLEYFAHLEHIGDTAWVRQGDFVGTRGQSRRLEGFAIRAAGRDAWKYNVYYSAHL